MLKNCMTNNDPMLSVEHTFCINSLTNHDPNRWSIKKDQEQEIGQYTRQLTNLKCYHSWGF